jgi:photosystem II stability/assembly factor-like uncharacterized protein
MVGVDEQFILTLWSHSSTPGQVFAGDAAPYLSKQPTSVYRSTDGGLTWLPSDNGLLVDGSPPAVHALAGAPSLPSRLLTSAAGALFVSDDNGDSWNCRLEFCAQSAAHGRRIAFDSDDAECVWYARRSGGSGMQLLRSNDGGDTWAITLAAPLITDIVSTPIGDRLVLARGSTIATSDDGGEIWTTRVDIGADAEFEALEVVSRNGADILASVRVHAGSTSRVWLSRNMGLSWAPFDSGLPPEVTYVISLAADPGGSGLVYAGTQGAGTWQAELSEPVHVPPLHEAALGVRVHPSPFKQSVRIAVRYPARGPVSAEVFDVQGRRVWTSSMRSTDARVYAVSWDGVAASGRTVQPGVYVLRVTTPTSSQDRLVVRLPR